MRPDADAAELKEGRSQREGGVTWSPFLTS